MRVYAVMHGFVLDTVILNMLPFVSEKAADAERADKTIWALGGYADFPRVPNLAPTHRRFMDREPDVRVRTDRALLLLLECACACDLRRVARRGGDHDLVGAADLRCAARHDGRADDDGHLLERRHCGHLPQPGKPHHCLRARLPPLHGR
eukprot:5089909-Prymnesium_polylepis.1